MGLLYSQLKKDLIYLKASALYFLFGFLIAPLVLGMIYGLMFSKMMAVDIELEDLKVYVAVNDQQEKLNALEPILAQDFVILELTDEEEVKQRYQESGSMGIVLEDTGLSIYNHNGNTTEKSLLMEMLRYSQLSQWKVQYDQELVPMEVVEQVPVLNSYEYFIISVYMGMSLFIAITFATYFIKQKHQSMMGRIFSMNMHKRQFYCITVVSIFMISLVLITLYSYIAYKVVLQMEFSMVQMLVANSLHAGFLAGLFGISISLVNDEKVYKTYVTPVVMVMFILGGSFFPIDIFDKPLSFVYVMPNYELLNIYKGILLNDSSLLTTGSLAIGAMSIILLAIGAYCFPKTEIR